jgi:hypothetical protein
MGRIQLVPPHLELPPPRFGGGGEGEFQLPNLLRRPLGVAAHVDPFVKANFETKDITCKVQQGLKPRRFQAMVWVNCIQLPAAAPS